MAYIDPADFALATKKPWTEGLLLEVDETYLATVISLATSRVELELDDDFEPPNSDNDETIYVDGTIGSRLHIPRRVRALTTVSRRSLSGTITAISGTSYRLHSSLNADGTAMLEGRKRDWLDSGSATTWFSDGGVELIGKFGWAAVPDDIKRLVALFVYDMVKPSGDPMGRMTQLATVDAVHTFGEPREIVEIMKRYGRKMAMVA